MGGWLLILLMVATGAALAFQSPINAALSRTVGVYEAALVSFAVGTVLAVGVVLVAGKGSLRGVTVVPGWQLVGGAIGLLYITSMIATVQRVGLTPVVVAGLAGQLAASLAIDHFGWFGVPQRSVDATRLLGLALLFGGLWLVYARR